jgi:quinol monooxygenase YgiN
MIDLTIKMTVPPEKRKEVLQTVKFMLHPLRRERGCISCNYLADVEDEGVFWFREVWTSREELDNHFRSDRFGVLIGVMSLLSAEPVVEISAVTATAGVEAIRAARS